MTSIDNQNSRALSVKEMTDLSHMLNSCSDWNKRVVCTQKTWLTANMDHSVISMEG